MKRVLTDEEIMALIEEPKYLPRNWQARLSLISARDGRYKRRDLDVKGEEHNFKVRLRLLDRNPFDFSIILALIDDDGREYCLVRFNGKHQSQHTNVLEPGRPKFSQEFHIHRATERYQRAGRRIEHYAEPTKRYFSYESALQLFVSEHGFRIEGDDDDGLLPFASKGGASA